MAITQKCRDRDLTAHGAEVVKMHLRLLDQSGLVTHATSGAQLERVARLGCECAAKELHAKQCKDEHCEGNEQDKVGHLRDGAEEGREHDVQASPLAHQSKHAQDSEHAQHPQESELDTWNRVRFKVGLGLGLELASGLEPGLGACWGPEGKRVC